MALRDTRSYETQIIDAVRSVNRALGGTYGTSSAIYKSEFNQYEVQLIDAIKGISRTLNGKGLTGVGGGGVADLSGYVTSAQFQDLSRRVTTLENESFFRLVDGNVTLKDGYSNLWVPGFLAAGGIGSGSSGGSVVSVSQILTSGTAIATITVDGVATTIYAPSGGGGSGSVNSVKVGNTAYNPDSNGVVSLPAYPTTLPASDVYSWAKQSTKPSYSFSELTTHPTTVAGYGITDAVSAQDLANLAARVTSIEGWFEVLNVGTSASPEYALHAKNGYAIYSDSWVSAGGVGTGGGGGGSLDLVAMWNSLTNSVSDAYANTQIAAAHLPASLKNPYALTFGTKTYDGSAAKTITASDLGALSSVAFSDLTTHPTTIAGYGITDAKIANGVITLGSDTITPLTSHQTIYTLTFAAGSFSAGTYTPNSAAKTINVPTTLDHVADGTSRKLSDYLPKAGGTMTGDLIMSGANIRPSTNNTCSLGTSSYRWAGIYGVDENLSGNLSLAQTSHIDIGPLRIEYDSIYKSIHITKVDSNDANNYGIYADGFVAAGGPQQSS